MSVWVLLWTRIYGNIEVCKDTGTYTWHKPTHASARSCLCKSYRCAFELRILSCVIDSLVEVVSTVELSLFEEASFVERTSTNDALYAVLMPRTVAHIQKETINDRQMTSGTRLQLSSSRLSAPQHCCLQFRLINRLSIFPSKARTIRGL